MIFGFKGTKVWGIAATQDGSLLDGCFLVDSATVREYCCSDGGNTWVDGGNTWVDGGGIGTG